MIRSMTMLWLFTLIISIPAGAGEWVSFEVDSAPPTALQLRMAKAGGEPPRQAPPTVLRAKLFRPAGEGSFPALVLLHGCRGLQPFQEQWAEQLTEWGYVALLVDSFGSRESKALCTKLTDIEARQVFGGRGYDAYGALAYLTTLPYVDKHRIGVMGWAYSAVLGSVIEDGVQQFFKRKFKVAVSFYPDCGFTTTGQFIQPVMVLIGEQDDWTPATVCQKMAKAGANRPYPPQVQVYPGVGHGFDDPDVGEHLYLEHARNLYKDPALGATLSYDHAAHQDALKRVKTFLDQQLRFRPLSVTLDDLPAVVSETQVQNAIWAIDPDDPSSNLPPLGRSVFDQLFTRLENGHRVYAIPFPFSRLIRKLEEQVATTESGASGLRKVLIPQGRSLQRNAASPDFFRYPRVLLAVDTEPPVHDGIASLWLKDRLFLGYQEKSQILEVISYNEAAARFEFQVVKDYASGRRPRVYYADRTLCVSCHQNAAPLFANAPWDETNANGDVMAELGKQREDFYGIPANQSGSSVNALDRAANRATLLAVYQRLWRQGCGAQGVHAIRCRTAALIAMLQYRLSLSTHFDSQSGGYRDHYLAVLSENWRQQWPRGLLIPAANIPDRDPFLERGRIPAQLDPLTRRAPAALWFYSKDLNRLITGLSEQLLTADIRRLDAHLYNQGAPAAGQSYRGFCRFDKRNARGPIYQGTLTCRSDSDRGLRLSARVSIDPHKGIRGILHWLELGESIRLLDLTFPETMIQRRQGHWQVNVPLYHKHSGLHARMPDGNAIQHLQLSGQDALGTQQLLLPPVVFTAEANLPVMDDFAPVRRVIAEMTTEAETGQSNLFDNKPFRSLEVMAALFSKLGLLPTRHCCQSTDAMPAAHLETVNAVTDSNNGDDQSKLFYRYCGRCHHTDNRFPPPFLAGSPSQVAANLARCAQRIAFRLQMWRLAPEQRPKTPMPPTPPSDPKTGIRLSVHQWSDSTGLASLQDHVERLLAAQGELSNPKTLLDQGYEQMQACIPVL